MRLFLYKVVWPNKPIRAPDKHPKLFFIMVSNLPRSLTFHTFSVLPFRIFTIHKKIASAYSQYMNRFIPRFQSISTMTFCFKIWRILHILCACTDSFLLLSVHEKIHSVYSQYTYRFLPRTWRMRKNNFEHMQLNSFLHSFKGIPTSKTVCIYTVCITGP